MPFKTLDTEKAVLLLAFLFVAMLGVNEQLNLYIHPRYITFTAALTALGLIVLLAGFKNKDSHTEHSSKLTLLPLVFILGAALILPARSLTSATVSQRAIDSGSLVTSTNSKPISSLFAGSSRGLKLADWSRLLQTNNDPDYYVNKPAKISGFVYDAGLGQNNVWLARFVLTCCAVDAQPVGVPVQIDGWADSYEEDQWLEVEGEFSSNEGGEIVLVPSSVSEVVQPRDPYAN